MFSWKKKTTDDFDIISSAAPLIAMTIKLMKRKQKGKKPFTEDFSYESKMDCLKKALTECENTEVLNPKMRKYFRDCSDIALACVDQVKMESLKNDYRYLSEALSLLACYVAGQN
jgi:hypothetical protein